MVRFLLSVLLVVAPLISEAARIDTLSIATAHLESPGRVLIIAPDGAASEPRPSLYLLHGFSDNHLDWMRIRPDLPALADAYGIHIIMPDGRDSWYWDSPLDSTMHMESFFVDDLVPFVDNRYNTIPHPSKRAITGLSMGGHGAMWLAFRHPDIWRNVGSMSGGLDIRPFPDSWKMALRLGARDENPEVWDRHTVVNLVPMLEPGIFNIVFDCGIDDFFYGVNEDMHRALIRAGIAHDFTSRPGAHTADYWANSILYHLLFFSQHF